MTRTVRRLVRPRTALALAGIAGIAACGSHARHEPPRLDGRAIFITAGCAGCHTLAAANAHGRIGPDLDTSTPRPTRAEVRFRLTYGAGGMPSFQRRLSEEQMQAVAAFVARSAGKGARRPRR